MFASNEIDDMSSITVNVLKNFKCLFGYTTLKRGSIQNIVTSLAWFLAGFTGGYRLLFSFRWLEACRHQKISQVFWARKAITGGFGIAS